MQPGLISSSTAPDGLPEGPWAVPLKDWNPCPIGAVAVDFFSMLFLTKEERHGMIYHAADRLEKTGLSFQAIIDSQWPVFGIIARLSELANADGAARPVDSTCELASPLPSPTSAFESSSGKFGKVDAAVSPTVALMSLQREVIDRVAQRRPVPGALAQRIVVMISSAESSFVSTSNPAAAAASAKAAAEAAFADAAATPTVIAGCALALATAWAAFADAASRRGDDVAVTAAVHRAEALVRTVKTDYTHLDWLSTRWPLFRLLHRLQFGLCCGTVDDSFTGGDSVEAVRGPDPDLVPHDLETGLPLRFVFNQGLTHQDPLFIDVAADIVHTDLLRTLPRFFGMSPAQHGEPWSVNMFYSSTDWTLLRTDPKLMRLRSSSQRLIFSPRAMDVSEKDEHCGIHRDAMRHFGVKPSFEHEVGGSPLCFKVPPKSNSEIHDILAQDTGGSPVVGDLDAFVRKPEGLWGGRGIEIKFGFDDLLGLNHGDSEWTEPCTFTEMHDVQCFGLEAAPEATREETFSSAEACRTACCEETEVPCDAWNWRQGDGCWIGKPRHCSERNAMYFGGWVGGQRLRGKAAVPRAVVQRYVMDPVLYQLEGIHPPLRVKTDIRVYGSVVSLDPVRVFVSRHGYFRTGSLERNFSTATNEDLADDLMHITHHIPKIENGTFQCPTAPSWGDPGMAERDAGSGGSLRKWFRIARDQNGLEPKEVWDNIRDVIGQHVLGIAQDLSCATHTPGNDGLLLRHACGSHSFNFFADLVVDSLGRAWVMEVHPTLALKSHGLGDPEAGWVEVLTRAARQGSIGSLAMFFTSWMNEPYRRWAERFVRRRVLVAQRPRWRRDIARLKRERARVLKDESPPPGELARDVATGEAPTLAALLARMLVEEHMACRLGVDAVLPLRWRKIQRHFPKVSERRAAPLDKNGDIFGRGLRSIYRLRDEARRKALKAHRERRSAIGDLRPRRCVEVDFNAHTVWDQPWERSTRRFKV
eukprot:TRINITY_DN55609_c0_g1_i1.p1 TRINITY_DN55609_c0_g1~~TRINITY_DN55609_c0_g1_i1.p1  ORF type:complete len:1093 (-),score=161.93 TRINITY_DN55609_c0_g1_i1:277-3228(-)